MVPQVILDALDTLNRMRRETGVGMITTSRFFLTLGSEVYRIFWDSADQQWKLWEDIGD